MRNIEDKTKYQLKLSEKPTTPILIGLAYVYSLGLKENGGPWGYHLHIIETKKRKRTGYILTMDDKDNIYLEPHGNRGFRSTSIKKMSAYATNNFLQEVKEKLKGISRSDLKTPGNKAVKIGKAA